MSKKKREKDRKKGIKTAQKKAKPKTENMPKPIHLWEKPYTQEPKHNLLHIIRSNIQGVVSIRPVLTPVTTPTFMKTTPRAREGSRNRPLPVLEVEVKGSGKDALNRMDAHFNLKRKLPFSYTHLRSLSDDELPDYMKEIMERFGNVAAPTKNPPEKTSRIFIMMSSIYHRHGDNPPAEVKQHYRRAMGDMRVAVDSLIAKRLGINVPELKTAYIEHLRKQGKIKTKEDKHEAENTVDRALSAESHEYGIKEQSPQLKALLGELQGLQ